MSYNDKLRMQTVREQGLGQKAINLSRVSILTREIPTGSTPAGAQNTGGV